MTTKPDIRLAFLDAAERLLIEEGLEGISTRRLAREAGLNHGLVHYYFGTVDNLILAVFERFTDRLAERQRAMYSADVPFLEKWRTAMGYMDEDLAAGYPKIWAELQAAAMNDADLQRRLPARVRHVALGADRRIHGRRTRVRRERRTPSQRS